MIGVDFGLVSGCLFLVLFSIYFDMAYERAARTPFTERYSGIFIAGGAAMVGLVFGLVTGRWMDVAKLALLSISAGANMIIGAARRATRRDQGERERIKKELKDGHSS